MIQRLGRLLMPLVLAVIALAVLPSVAEVWLRWQEFQIGRPLLVADPQDELLAPSWLTHHELKPLRTVTSKNPDTGESFETGINSFGMRAPEPAIPKPSGVVRVLLLGDETVLGLEVSDQQTLAACLEERLRVSSRQEVEVLCGAVPGDCALLAAIRLRHTLAALRPDLVICHFDMTDVADDYSLRRHAVLGRGDIPLACPDPHLERPVRGVGQEIGDHFLLARFAQRQLANFWKQERPEQATAEIHQPLAKYAWLEDDPPDWSLHIQQAFSALDDVSHVAAEQASQLLIATCPAPWQVSADASSGPGVRAAAGVPDGALYRSDLPFRLLAEFCRERGLTLCDTSPEFRSQPQADLLFLTNAPRLSADGHDLYAAAIARHLTVKSSDQTPPTANGRRLPSLR